MQQSKLQNLAIHSSWSSTHDWLLSLYVLATNVAETHESTGLDLDDTQYVPLQHASMHIPVDKRMTQCLPTGLHACAQIEPDTVNDELNSGECLCCLPLADGGAVIGMSPAILKVLNWTATLLFDIGVSSAVTCGSNASSKMQLSYSRQAHILMNLLGSATDAYTGLNSSSCAASASSLQHEDAASGDVTCP